MRARNELTRLLRQGAEGRWIELPIDIPIAARPRVETDPVPSQLVYEAFAIRVGRSADPAASRIEDRPTLRCVRRPDPMPDDDAPPAIQTGRACEPLGHAGAILSSDPGENDGTMIQQRRIVGAAWLDAVTAAKQPGVSHQELLEERGPTVWVEGPRIRVLLDHLRWGADRQAPVWNARRNERIDADDAVPADPNTRIDRGARDPGEIADLHAVERH